VDSVIHQPGEMVASDGSVKTNADSYSARLFRHHLLCSMSAQDQKVRVCADGVISVARYYRRLMSLPANRRTTYLLNPAQGQYYSGIVQN